MSRSKVSLILGPARSGKTRRALKRYLEYLDACRANPDQPLAVWVAPTPSAASDVRDLLASESRGGFVHLGVLSFARLADEILARAGARVRAIGTLEKHRILEQLVRGFLKADRFRYFTAIAESKGFIRQLAGTISDLKRRDIWPEDFRGRSRDDRDRDFLLVYDAYQEHLNRHNLFDSEGRLWAAREALQSPSPVPRGGGLGFGLVVVDGFADFTSSQHDLLRLLSEYCQGLVITLPADHDESQRELLFDKPRRTREILEKSFPGLDREIVRDGQRSTASLQLVEKSLFDEEPPNAVPPSEGLAIVAASSVQAEIREIARRVKRLLISGRARCDDIAVVFPSVAEVAHRIEEVFADFGLPLALDYRRPLSTLPVFRTLSKLLRLHAEDWPFSLLLDVIGNPHFQIGSALGLPSHSVDAFTATERSIRRAQLPSSRSLLVEQLRYWATEPQAPASGDSESASAATEPDASAFGSKTVSPDASAFGSSVDEIALDARAALPILEGLEQLLDTLPERATLEVWLTHLERLVPAIGLPSHSDEWALLRKGLVLIQQMDLTLEAEPATYSPQQFLRLLESTASQVPLPNKTDPTGRVRVLSAEAARNLSLKHLFLAGLSEQSYSSAEGSRQIYREQDVLRLAGEESTNVVERQAGEAMLLFYDMVTRPSETLTLSYPAIDDKGQALPPSPYLTELERWLPIPTIHMPIGAEYEPKLADTSTSGSQSAATGEVLGQSDWRLAAMTTALGGNREWLAGLVGETGAPSLGQALLRGISSVASRSSRNAFGPFEGLLLSEGAREVIARRFSSEHLWSASQLEKYATCPYQFFASYLLRLEPLAEIELRSDHLRRGQLLHQVLAAVHTQPLESGSGAELVERFSGALEELISRMPLQGLEDALREIERREILAWATSYAKQEEDYGKKWNSWDEPPKPAYFEVRFGPKASAADVNDAVSTHLPFTLDLGGEKIQLSGQIDRIDMGQIHGVTVFNIIDYKSGQQVKLTDKSISAGQQLQLPLYALAAERLLFADRQAVALATGYWNIKHEGFAKGREAMLEFRTSGETGLVDSDRWQKLSPIITEKIAKIVQGIRAGQFPVHNTDSDCTRYCDFSKICRVAQVRSLEKIWTSTDDTT